MMQAQTVWHVWRRIMREVPLQQALWGEGASLDDGALAPFGLDADARQIARAYARESDRARWFVLNYRFRLTNSFLNALETGAPLVVRALLNRGIAIPALAEEFLDTQQWKDFGPFVYGYCDTALRFLASHDVAKASAGLGDLIGLEHTVVSLMRGLGSGPQTTDVGDETVLRRLPTAMSYRTSTRLSRWLRDKPSLGQGDLEAAEEHYLVYLPFPEAGHKYALLPPRAAHLLDTLETPCRPGELPDRLVARGHAATTPDDPRHLQHLQSMKAICGHVG